ncbi:uncharacterized protein VTP21DRAFT_1712 [Calcarisporiella thermophila]|uniref:uncharacterized protein n=1 Tax=Calcarisporiella thermophila TaxID=911321 RepID=UPI0037438041
MNSSSPNSRRSEREYQDCLPCRLTGSAAFTGLGIYAFYQANLPKANLKQPARVGLGVMGLVFISAGLFRLIV